MSMSVKVWTEKVKIPTYKIGKPDKNPMFLEKRVYQGSSGVVYPHAVIDKVYDEKEEKEWLACFLENDYLKVMILPELGGRIQMAYDKTNDYHFVYYNQVIKPALVGLAGPWISGGIEFNWPQHHRPSTFDPIDYCIEKNEDGSATIWVNEYEKMFRTKCKLGFTVYPDKAYIELHAQLYNRTPFPQTFLWWANPAVAVNENYQSIFPPDVHAVYDHGKRDVSSFPIATGTYYKVDYSAGTDISRYTNIPVPTSYMAVDSAFNFMGGYDHGKKAGIMHIADHHVSPGKKQWTWGCGEFGKAWDRQLTDEDGPYFELMCGVFTDNQPDFSWIMPDETRHFKQYFMPYKDIGYVKNASVDAMVNLEFENGQAIFQVYVTQPGKVRIELKNKAQIIFSETKHLTPRSGYKNTIEINSAENTTLSVFDENDKLLVSYTPVNKTEDAIPDPANPIPEPEKVSTIEELYLAGLHLEQYRHATYSPIDYYKEGLKRDAGDIRCNNALGLLCLRRGQFAEAEAYLKTAVKRITKHNLNPYDGECVYNLGLTLKYQNKLDEAFDNFYKATWNASWQHNGFLQMAYICSAKKDWEQALAFSKQALTRNFESVKIRHIQIVALRQLERIEEVMQLIEETIKIDRFAYSILFEEYLILQKANKTELAQEKLKELISLTREDADTFIEIAIDYANGGNYAEAIALLELLQETDYPIVHYYKALYHSKNGDNLEAKRSAQNGGDCKPDCVFPNRIEDIEALLNATALNESDYKALYYLGNLYYDKKRYSDAVQAWQDSIKINDAFATTHRNLGIAYYNKLKLTQEALKHYERAFEIDPSDSRVLFELDNLYKRIKKSPIERLKFLNKYGSLIEERDDLYIEYVSLHTVTGKLKEARHLLLQRNFHPWEGGEGKVSGQYVTMHIELAKAALSENNFQSAIQLLEKAKEYPHSLGEGKLYGTLENEIDYWLGCAYDSLGMDKKAIEYWQHASQHDLELKPAIFYNDQQPEKLFYKALSLIKLGKIEAADTCFENFINYGKEHLNDEVKIDFFAVSLPDLMIFDDDLSARNIIHCHYLIGLGFLGLKNYPDAEQSFRKALELEPSHLGVAIHYNMLRQERLPEPV
jgi:tetratricopeptide (TPR) repeat protein